MSSFYALADMDRTYYYVFMLSFYITVLITKVFPKFKIRKVKGSNKILILITVFISISVYGFLIKLNGVPSLTAFNLSRVYEIRGETLYGPEFLKYLVGWIANVLNCFLVGLAVDKRKYWLLILTIFLQMIIFAITGHKSMFFAPVAVFFLVIAIKKWILMRFATLSLLSIFVFCYMVHAMGISSLPASLLIRRVFFGPAHVSYCYFDFFSKHPHVYLAQSKMGFGLAENPYESYGEPMPEMLGTEYLGSDEVYMNTGYMGDGFMNFGYMGMLLFSYILGLILVVVDSLSTKTKLEVAIACIIIPIQKLINGSFFTTMLTGGILFGLLILFLYKEESQLEIIE